MKLVVTGCNGRVGRRVVLLALDEGHQVIGVDLSKPSSFIEDADAQRISAYETFSFIKADLREFEQALNALRGCDGVAHLAAYPDPGDYLWQTHNSNVVISWNVLRAAAELGIKRIAQASTCNVVRMVYSKSGAKPEYFPIDEDHPCEPDEPYGLSKVIAELQADTIVRGYQGIRIASLRLHWAVPNRDYASRDDPIRRRNDLWGWVHHDSAAEAFLLALASNSSGSEDWTGHEAFFICAPDTADERESTELYQTFWPHVPVREGFALGGRVGFFDCSKAKRLLGWEHRNITNEVVN